MNVEHDSTAVLQDLETKEVARVLLHLSACLTSQAPWRVHGGLGASLPLLYRALLRLL